MYAIVILALKLIETNYSYRALRSVRKKRPFIISRDSYSGQGVFGGHWSGDIFSSWEDLRYSVRCKYVYIYVFHLHFSYKFCGE